MPRLDRQLVIGVDLRALVGTPTGIGFYTLALLERLGDFDDLSLIGLSHRAPEHADRLRSAGVRLEIQSALSGVVWQQTVLARRLGRGDLDVFWSPILTLPLRLAVPAVTTVHDLTPLLHPEMHRFKVRWSIRPFLARNLSAASGVVVDSESTAADLRRYYGDCAEKVTVVYPGVDAVFVPGDVSEIRATRERLGYPEGYLLYSGTLEPRKNLDFLLDAWETAKAREPATLPLVLTGPAGWADRSLYRRLDSLEGRGVSWLGRLPREELVAVMQAARWFVYPSLYEGFGLPVAEAMACGVPVIASEATSLPEIVGDTGHLIDPYDREGFAHLLQALPHQQAAEADLGARARRRAARFDWARAAAGLRATLRSASVISV